MRALGWWLPPVLVTLGSVLAVVVAAAVGLGTEIGGQNGSLAAPLVNSVVAWVAVLCLELAVPVGACLIAIRSEARRAWLGGAALSIVAMPVTGLGVAVLAYGSLLLFTA